MYSNNNQIVISVVICTRNSSDRIQETLDSVCFQKLDRNRYEILIIENGSDDDTYLWLENHLGDYRYRLYQEPVIGLSAARNRGIKEARGEYIYFIDDDAVASAHLLSTLVLDIKDKSPDVLGGPIHGLWDETPPEWLHSGFWRSLSLLSWGAHKRLLTYPEILIGCNIAIRRDIFKRYGLFDPALGRKGAQLFGNEERVLEKRIMTAGGTVFYNPKAYVFHKVPKSRMQASYFRQRYKHGAYSTLAMEQIEDTISRSDKLQCGLRSSGLKKRIKKIRNTFLIKPIILFFKRIAVLIKVFCQLYPIFKIQLSILQGSKEGWDQYWAENKNNDL